MGQIVGYLLASTCLGNIPLRMAWPKDLDADAFPNLDRSAAAVVR
jgi:hypothetical protein